LPNEVRGMATSLFLDVSADLGIVLLVADPRAVESGLHGCSWG